MLYRALHSINSWYALMVLWTYIGAFLLAFGFIFVFPQVTLLLLFAGVGGLGVAMIGGRLLSGVEHSIARHALAKRTCPRCHDHAIAHSQTPEASWRCGSCGAVFDESGMRIEPSQDSPP